MAGVAGPGLIVDLVQQVHIPHACTLRVTLAWPLFVSVSSSLFEYVYQVCCLMPYFSLLLYAGLV